MDLAQTTDLTRRTLTRYREVQGNTTAAAMTLSLFMAMFPLALLVAAVAGKVSASNGDPGRWVVDRLGLSGASASLVTDSLTGAADHVGALSIVGALGLLWSATGVAAGLALAVDRAWQRQPRRLVRRLTAAARLGVLGVGLAAATVATTTLLAVLPGPADVLTLLSGAVVQAVLVTAIYTTLGPPGVGWRAHAAGGALTMIGMEIVTWVSATLVPLASRGGTGLFGSLGAVFALVSWLLLLGRFIVLGAVLNVLRYEEKAGTHILEVEVPYLPGDTPAGVDRAGAAVPAED